jgi:hypothetical protein
MFLWHMGRPVKPVLTGLSPFHAPRLSMPLADFNGSQGSETSEIIRLVKQFHLLARRTGVPGAALMSATCGRLDNRREGIGTVRQNRREQVQASFQNNPVKGGPERNADGVRGRSHREGIT